MMKIVPFQNKLWLIDSGWACGGVFTKNNLIVNTCPIFRKLLGKDITKIPYKIERAYGL